MAQQSIFRERALRRRELGVERSLPPPPIPSGRTIALLWGLLALALAATIALGHTVEQALDEPSAAATETPEDLQ